MNPDDFEAARIRREKLPVTPNPDASHDYVSDLKRACAAEPLGDVQLRIRYVPDRGILASGALDAYLPALAAMAPASLERLALIFIEDINDALIPRWVEITASLDGGHAGGGHMVAIEDRQPGWDNQRLLNRLPPA